MRKQPKKVVEEEKKKDEFHEERLKIKTDDYDVNKYISKKDKLHQARMDGMEEKKMASDTDPGAS